MRAVGSSWILAEQAHCGLLSAGARPARAGGAAPFIPERAGGGLRQAHREQKGSPGTHRVERCGRRSRRLRRLKHLSGTSSTSTAGGGGGGPRRGRVARRAAAPRAGRGGLRLGRARRRGAGHGALHRPVPGAAPRGAGHVAQAAPGRPRRHLFRESPASALRAPAHVRRPHVCSTASHPPTRTSQALRKTKFSTAWRVGQKVYRWTTLGWSAVQVRPLSGGSTTTRHAPAQSCVARALAPSLLSLDADVPEPVPDSGGRDGAPHGVQGGRAGLHAMIIAMRARQEQAHPQLL